MDTTLILTGVACVVAAIIGGGVKLLQVEVRVFDSLQRQFLLALFGAGLIVAGLIAGGHLRMPERAPSEPAEATPQTTPAPSPSTDASDLAQTGVMPAPAPLETPLAAEASEQRDAATAAGNGAVTRPSAPSRCEDWYGHEGGEWRQRYFHPTESGSYHIFVETLPASASQDGAEAAAARWRILHPNNWFEPMPTASSSNGNQRWAIVAAAGLDEGTARALTRYVKECGVEPRAYAFQQDVGPAGF